MEIKPGFVLVVLLLVLVLELHHCKSALTACLHRHIKNQTLNKEVMKTQWKSVLVAVTLLIVSDAHAMRWYSPNTGRWLSRDPIQEEGGINLYAFVGNSPVNAIDLFGMYTKSGTTFSVDECEILIVYGHQDPGDPWKFTFPPVGKAAGGGAIVCWPGRANKNIPQHNKISAPEHDKKIVWWEGTSEKAKQERILNEWPLGAGEL